MSVDGTIRMPDGTHVPLVLPGEGAEPEPADEPGETVRAGWPEEVSLPLLTDEQWDDLQLDRREPEPFLLGLHAELPPGPVTFEIERPLPTVGELLRMPENVARREAARREQDWVAERLMAGLREDVDLVALQESIAREVARGFWRGARAGALATLGLGLAWAIVDRVVNPWR